MYIPLNAIEKQPVKKYKAQKDLNSRIFGELLSIVDILIIISPN
jgi:hypothetical protein